MIPLLALAGFVASLTALPICRTISRRLGYVAAPRRDRWHSQPTALLGGIGIAVPVLLISVATGNARQLPIVAGGTALIFGLGLLDDVVTLKPYAKLVGEIAVASLFLFFGYRLQWSASLTLDTLLTLVWIVGLTNALNLLDNMDGLAGGVAAIAGAALLATFLLNGGVTPEARYLAILIGAVAGFLVYNIHPASIFMGDSGSLFIGLNLAVLTLVSPTASNGPASVLSIIAAPVLLLLIPIFDTTLVTLVRIFSGRSATQGGRDHSSHRLVAIGLSQRAAVTVLWALSALGGLLALSLRSVRLEWASIGAAIFVVAMVIFAVYLAQVRVYDEADEALLQSGRVTPFFVDFMYRRRLFEVVLDVCLASIAYYTAYRLRFEGRDFSAFFRLFLQSLPLVVGVQTVAFFAVGTYRGVWRYFGLMDGVTIAKGVLTGTLSTICVILYLYRFENYSRGVFVIYAALLMLMVSGARASFRLISEFAHRRRQAGPRLIIYGTGDVGASAVRDLLGRRPDGYRMLGFIDDDPDMARARMQGFPVLGDFQALVSLIANDAVEIVVITRLVDTDRLGQLQALCGRHEVELARLHLVLDQLVAVS